MRCWVGLLSDDLIGPRCVVCRRSDEDADEDCEDVAMTTEADTGYADSPLPESIDPASSQLSSARLHAEDSCLSNTPTEAEEYEDDETTETETLPAAVRRRSLEPIRESSPEPEETEEVPQKVPDMVPEKVPVLVLEKVPEKVLEKIPETVSDVLRVPERSVVTAPVMAPPSASRPPRQRLVPECEATRPVQYGPRGATSPSQALSESRRDAGAETTPLRLIDATLGKRPRVSGWHRTARLSRGVHASRGQGACHNGGDHVLHSSTRSHWQQSHASRSYVSCACRTIINARMQISMRFIPCFISFFRAQIRETTKVDDVYVFCFLLKLMLLTFSLPGFVDLLSGSSFIILHVCSVSFQQHITQVSCCLLFD